MSESQTMRAELIAIGDELIDGSQIDTNSPWISRQLASLGIRVVFHTTIGDDLESMTAGLRTAIQRADLVIATGGLGPTADDLTRHALAAAAGRELELRQDVLHHIQNLFASRGRVMPARNSIQAEFPTDSRVIDNPHGTAPGIHLEVAEEGTRPTPVIVLPGVPAEMREMWAESVIRIIQSQFPDGGGMIRDRTIRCFGIGESALEEKLPDLIRRGRQPEVGITVHDATISLRIKARGMSDDECDRLIEPVARTIYQCLGSLVFGEGDDRLQNVVVRLLQKHHVTLASVEWGTEGLVAHWLREASAGRSVFRGGEVLGDHGLPATPFTAGLPSAEPEADMARQVCDAAKHARSHFGAGWGVAVGRAPKPSQAGSAHGYIQFALATPHACFSKTSPYAGHPRLLKARAAKQALNLVRLELLKAPK